MAGDYYMGNGIMMNYGETYEMKKEELVKVLDEYVEALKRVEAERDKLQTEVLRLKYPDADLFELDLLNKT
jgi:hypothetical protein